MSNFLENFAKGATAMASSAILAFIVTVWVKVIYTIVVFAWSLW